MDAQRPDRSNQSRPLTGTTGGATPAQSSATISESPDGKATSPDTPVRDQLSLDSSLGAYKLLHKLKIGGMGVVYKAQDSAGNLLAIKTIRLDRGATREFLQRFKREVEAVQRLKHPNILAIREVGEADGYPFFTMEFIAQGSLSEHRPRFQSDPRAAVRLVEQIARGVQHAHEQGILHRDLKPGNILLGDSDHPLVSDFGLAKVIGTDADLTHTGQQLGTLPYMAPEQALGRVHQISPRSDIWALGVILYELLAGQRPFRAEDDVALIHQIESDVPTRPSSVRPEVAPALEAIVFKCLAKNPEDRYESAKDLADDLGRWQSGRPPTFGAPSLPRRIARRIARHPWWAAAAVFAVALVISAAVIAPRLDPERIRRQQEEKLARGEKVEWIPEQGWPHSPQVILGEPGATGALGKDGVFSLSSVGAALFEFLPDPKCDRYRIHGWVRQDDNSEDGLVGFYFGHSRRNNAVSFYAIYGFAEDNLEAGKARVDLYYLPDENLHWGRQPTPLNMRLPENQRRRGTWRELALEVSPEKISAAFDGTSLGTLPRADLDLRIKRLLKGLPQFDPTPAFAPRDGLGLFVHRGAASFKAVTIQPMPAGNP